MWELYDALIEGIPDDIIVDELIVGGGATLIEANGGIGLANFRDYYSHRASTLTGNLIGMSLKKVASCVKSWNFREAAVGHAALNAYYNHPEIAKKAGIEIAASKNVNDQLKTRLKDPFIKYQNLVKDKKVCVVGYSRLLDELFAPVCDLSVIEWDAPLRCYSDSGYPFSACEFLLPECDYAFLTCSAIPEKNMPRLLELSENATGIIITGMATTLSSVFFDYGVTDIAGFIVTDPERVKLIHKGAENGYCLCQAPEAITRVEYLKP
nr:DUF364 domain-containing protein [uncultured Methanospirillum sp.]